MDKIVVAAAVVTHGDRVLVSSRPAGKNLAGQWEFPGGKVEAGESVRAALHREMREELDCEVIIFDQLYRLSLLRRNGGELEILFFRCAVPRPETIRAREAQEWRWVRRDELDSVALLAADRPVADFLRLAYNKSSDAVVNG